MTILATHGGVAAARRARIIEIDREVARSRRRTRRVSRVAGAAAPAAATAAADPDEPRWPAEPTEPAQLPARGRNVAQWFRGFACGIAAVFTGCGFAGRLRPPAVLYTDDAELWATLSPAEQRESNRGHWCDLAKLAANCLPTCCGCFCCGCAGNCGPLEVKESGAV